MAVSPTTIRRWSTLAIALLLVSGALTACGSGSSDSSTSSSAGSTPAPASDSAGGDTSTAADRSAGGGSAALAVSAVEQSADSLGFSKRALTARAGTVTLRLANGSGNQYPHGIALEGNGVDKDGSVVQPGGTSSVTVKLKPGTYMYYCPVPGHERYGMKGTLVVS